MAERDWNAGLSSLGSLSSFITKAANVYAAHHFGVGPRRAWGYTVSKMAPAPEGAAAEAREALTLPALPAATLCAQNPGAPNAQAARSQPQSGLLSPQVGGSLGGRPLVPPLGRGLACAHLRGVCLSRRTPQTEGPSEPCECLAQSWTQKTVAGGMMHE